MAKLTMQLKAKDAFDKSVTTSFTSVNPEASDSDKLQLAKAMNSLTSNTYSSTDLIKTINLDTETDAGKLTPTFSIAHSTITLTGQNMYAFEGITYDGDGKFFAGDYSVDIPGISLGFLNQGGWNLLIQAVPGAVPCTCKIMATETDTYKAAEITLTFVTT